MRLTRTEKASLTPLARWLLDYTEQHGITLTALARKADLSPGALRYLIREPGRQPTLETCLRLSRVTGKPADDLFALANLDAPEGAARFHPLRMELLQNYDTLPEQLQTVLLTTSRALRQATAGERQ